MAHLTRAARPLSVRLVPLTLCAVLVSAGCDDCSRLTRLGHVTTAPGLSLDAVSPSVGHTGAAVDVLITGSEFHPLRYQDVNELDGVGVDARFQAWLDDVPLEAVTLVDESTLSARVPKGLPAGRYALRVVAPDEQEASLADAYVSSAHAAPTLTAVSPRDVVNDAATPVDVSGAGFRDTTRVIVIDELGERTDLVVREQLADRLDALVPAELAPGSYAAEVVNDDEQRARLEDALVIHGAPALSVTLSRELDAAVAGQDVVVRALVRNDGASAADDVHLELDLSGDGSIEQDGDVTPSGVRIGAGSEVEMVIPLLASGAGSVVLAVTAVGESEHSGREVRSTVVQADALTVHAPAVLALEVLVTPALMSVGGEIGVTLRVRNSGGADALAVLPSVPVLEPSGMATLLEGFGDGALTIPGGGEADFELRYLAAAAASEGSFSASASGSEAHSGRALSAPSSSGDVDVRSAAALGSTLTISPDVLGVGQRATVTLLVENTGATAADDITPALTLPSALSVVSGPTPATYDLAGESSGSFSWQVEAAAVGAHSLSALAAGSDALSGVEVGAGASAASVTVVDAVSLSAAFTVPAVVSTGQSFTATLAVANDGGATAAAVTPRALTFAGDTGTSCTAATPSSRDVDAGGSGTFSYACTAGGVEGTAVLGVELDATNAVTSQPVVAGPFSSSGTAVEEAAALSLAWSVPSPVSTGQSFSATLDVTNSGGADAVDVTPGAATAAGSSGTECTGPTPASRTASGGAVASFSYACTAGPQAGQENLVASVTGTDVNSSAALSAGPTTSSSFVIHAAPSLTLSWKVPPQVTFGQQVSAVLTVKNLGDAAAVDVAPSNFLVLGDPPTLCGAPTPASGDVAGGGELVFTYACVIASEAGQNRVEARVSGSDENSGTAVGSAVVQSGVMEIVGPPGLIAAWTVPDVVSVGRSFTAELVVSNTGESAVENTSVSDAVINGAATCDPATPTGATIASDSSATFTFACVADSAPGTATLTSEASGVTVVGGNPVSSDALESPAVVVETPASLSLSFSQPASVSFGQTFTTSLTVTNAGQGTAVGVAPTALVVGGATGTTCQLPSPSSGSVAGGGVLAFHFTCTAGAAAGAVTFEAGVSGSDETTGDDVSAPAVTSAVTSVQSPPALALSWTFSQSSVSYDQAFSAQLLVENTGEASVSDVTPGALTLLGDTGTDCVGPTPASGAIAGGGSRTFTYTCTTAFTSGDARLRAGAAGSDSNSGAAIAAPAVTSSPLPVQSPPALVAAAVLEQASLSYGQSFTATLSVSNGGEAQAVSVAPTTLIVNGGSGTTCAAPIPADASIAGGASQDFTYACTAGSTSGAVSVSAAAEGEDGNSAVAVSAASSTSEPAVVQSPPDLSAGWTVSLSRASYGQTFVATLTVDNLGEADAVAVAPTGFTTTGATGTSCDAPSPLAANIDGLGSASFTYACTAGSTSGSAGFTAAAEGSDANTGAVATAGSVASSVVVIESPSSLVASWPSLPAAVSNGQPFVATLRVHNDGEADADVVTPDAVSVSGATGTSCGPPSPTSADIPGGSFVDFDYTCDAGSSSGGFTLSAGAAGSDVNTSASVSAAPVGGALTLQQRASLSLAWVVPSIVALSSPFAPELLVTNSGEAFADNVTPLDLSLAGPAGTTCGAATPTSVDIPGGEQRSFTFSCSSGATAGVATVSAGAGGADGNAGDAVSAPSLTSGAMAVSDNVAIRINEVVTDPQLDWSDDDGLAPYDHVPGTAAPDDADQWIELYNASDVPLDVSAYELSMVDGGGTRVLLLGAAGGGQQVLVDGGELTSWQPGDRIVIGNPAGSGRLGDDLYLALASEGGLLLDDTALGGSLGGDGDAGNNAPSGAASGFNDAVARAPDGSDTDDDAADFALAESTIGRDNDCPSRASLGYDNASAASGSGATLTFPHATAGTDRFLLVGTSTASVAVTGVTYAGVALSPVTSRAQGSARVELWSLANPAEGSHDVVVTFPATTAAAAGAISLTGAQQSRAVDASNTNAGTNATLGPSQPNVGLTTLEADAWVLGSVAAPAGEDLNAGAGQTRRWHLGTTRTSAGSTRGPLAAPGATTSNWTGLSSSLGGVPWAGAAASVRGQCQ